MSNVEQLKIHPHSLNMEQAVLVGAMVDSDGWDAISDILTEGDFYSRPHRAIFRAIKALYAAGKAVDEQLVADWLESNGLLTKIGGLPTLMVIFRNTPHSFVNSRIYAGRIREFAIQRKLLAAAEEITAEVFDSKGLSTEEILGRAESRILSVCGDNDSSMGIPINDSKAVLEDVFDGIQQNINRDEGELSGLDTGFASLNKKTDGLQPGDMIVIGARPSMGKTTLGMNLAESALFGQSLPVVVFSMESPSRQIGQRLLSSVSCVPMDKIRRGRFEATEYTKVSRATQELKERPLIVCDRGALTSNDMRSVLRRVAREHGGIGFILADYIQKMRPNIKNSKRTTNEEMTEISNDLKAIAMDYKCPFVVLSQLSRNCEQRPNKRPMNSDLRDCGGIEQDADLIIMLYRDEVYNPLKTDSPGLAELIITKNRNGETGTVMTRFIGSCFQFRDIA